MKRQHIKQYEHGIFRHFSLLRWYNCCVCKKDFRWEKDGGLSLVLFATGLAIGNTFVLSAYQQRKEQMNI